jgi:hypothetical protein
MTTRDSPSDEGHVAWLAEQVAPEDSGAQTQSRYRFQHECTARLCIPMIVRAGVLAVVCEEQEDFVVFYERDPPDLVSVKHRDGASGAWSFGALCGDGGVKHLYDRWLATGQKASCRMMTNAALSTGENGARSFADACHSRSIARVQPWIARLAAQLDASDHARVQEFALMLSIAAGLPSRDHIGAVNLRELVTPALKKLDLDVASAEHVYERIVAAVAKANRDAVGDQGDLLDVIADPAHLETAAANNRRLARRTITREIVATLLLPPELAAANLVVPSDDPPAPSRLQRKLVRGGLGPTVIDTAVRLRASWYGFESARRTSVPGGDPAFDDLRLRIQELVGLSESRMDRTVPYGPAMHLDVRETVTATGVANKLPFPLDDQLLQGLVFQLTDECKVWWSARFDVDSP